MRKSQRMSSKAHSGKYLNSFHGIFSHLFFSVLEKAGVVKLPENDFDIYDFVEKRIARLT